MKRLLTLSVVIFTVSISTPGVRAADDSVALFDGKSLTGWHVEGGKIESWQAEDGLLSCIAPGGGELTTDSIYADFVLTLEWRLPPGGNSGVGLRFPSNTHVSETGMEIQILDDDAPQHRDLKPAQYTGSIYYQVPAKQGAAHPPGEWNRYVITCKGPLVVVELNGREVVRANLDECTVGEGGLTPLAKRPRQGHIGLQSHNTRVDFRNIRLKKL